MNEMKVGKYTVVGKMAENVTDEEKEKSLKMLKNAILGELEKKKR